MKGRMRIVVLLLGVLGGRLQAADDAVPLGSDGCDHTFARAGHPEVVSRCARPSKTAAYCTYYVGGGCACKGGPPGPLQGTFGWDYCGKCLYPGHVVLRWCNRYQGGTGSYRTDGCPVPNVFNVKLPERGHGEEPACPSGHP